MGLSNWKIRQVIHRSILILSDISKVTAEVFVDKNKIDSHKLYLHPKRVSSWMEVNDWTNAKSVYPLYVEISPTGSCNHRCRFCAVDFMEYPDVCIEEELLKKRISEMAERGVKDRKSTRL